MALACAMARGGGGGAGGMYGGVRSLRRWHAWRRRRLVDRREIEESDTYDVKEDRRKPRPGGTVRAETTKTTAAAKADDMR